MLSAKNHIINSFIYALIFIGLPLMLALYFLLIWAHDHYIFLGTDEITHYVLICSGVLLGLVLHYTRLRWIVVTLLLYILLQVAMSFLEHTIASEDIDYYFLIHRITIKIVLFFIGIVTSYALLYSRLSNIVVSFTWVIISIYLVVHSDVLTAGWNTFQVYVIFGILAIAVVYSLFVQRKHHLLFTGSLQSNTKAYLQSLSFVLLIGVISVFHIFYFRDQIADMRLKMTKEFEPGVSESLEQQGDQGVKVNDKSTLSGSNSRSNQLLMVAYIDHWFEGTEVPNPLYLTTFYYTHFDSATETFKRMDDMPDKDLFLPDPTSVPLYFSQTDSSVLEVIKNNRHQKVVEIEVYNKGLEPNQFFAPSTSFSVQPIAIDKNFQQEYKNAYKAKSLVSDWNSAYFIYNSDQPEVVEFQMNRVNALKSVTDFSEMRSDIYAYYTQVPQLNYIQDLQRLTLELTASAPTPVEKIMAIKDYFQSKDEKGNPLFKYSDNPGIPDLPSASKLHHFMFVTKSGYCAYYAGATLLMLRSIGIPSRVSVGFLTQDRSTSNKGWYYYYANQLHAWVQVYFPGYGWIDFDTTIGNTEARESPQPDGTPPMSPPKATLSIIGTISTIDTVSNTVELMSSKMVIHDREYTLEEPKRIQVDVTKATLSHQNKPFTIQEIELKDTASVITFNKNLTQDIQINNIDSQIIPAERISIKKFEIKEDKSPSTSEFKKNTVSSQFITIVSVLTAIVLLLLSVPSLILNFYKRKSRHSTPKVAYQNAVNAMSFYAYQNDIVNVHKVLPSQYFKFLDEEFNTSTSSLYKKYQELKFSLHSHVANAVDVSDILQQIEKQYYSDKKFYFKWYNKINFVRAFRFLLH